jgi:hypothetical protein
MRTNWQDTKNQVWVQAIDLRRPGPNECFGGVYWDFVVNRVWWCIGDHVRGQICYPVWDQIQENKNEK